MKTINIKGKEYAPVSSRIKEFRENAKYAEWTIETEILEMGEVVLMKAIIKDVEGRIRAVGHAYEKENSTFINKTSYIENCETSAVGRALGFLGIGTDESIASAEEVANAVVQQNDPLDERPWMTDKQYNSAQKRIQSKDFGEFDNAEDFVNELIKTYRMKKAYKISLQESIEFFKKFEDKPQELFETAKETDG